MVIAQIEELLTKVQQLQSIMIAVATGESQIQYKQREYTQLYKDVAELLEFLEEEGVYIENPNCFKSLSDWRNYWSSNLKSGYASKGGYIHDLYTSFFNQIDIVLCQDYVKDKSQQELINEWQISRFEDLIVQIKELKLIMISVATQGDCISLIKYEDEGYRKRYQQVALQINILREIGIPIPNPNRFRSLWQWYNYWSFNLDKSYIIREEHINNLYETVLKLIEKALKRHCIQGTSLEEFIQELKSQFNRQISVQLTNHAILSTLINTSQESTQKLEESLQQQASESIYNSLSISSEPTQAIGNSLVTNTNDILNWTNENVMNPEVFLEQRDVTLLVMALNNFALKINVASDRQNILESAGIDSGFLSNLRFDTQSNVFAQSLVSAFKNYQISYQSLKYHPMVNLLKYLSDLAQMYSFRDQDLEFFNRLVEKGQENFKALAARNQVGRIESPIENPIGTGVIIKNNFLLTCNHIFSKSQVQKVWVRFGYKAGSYEFEKNVFELDVISNNSRLDYALLKIKPQTQQKAIYINENSILDSGQEIRIIHHPQGKPVVISDLGQILQVGEDYIDHNVKTDHGSSGAAIFNRQWELIAIHQGNVGIGRDFEPGTTGGIPIRSFWNEISSYLN
jgi:S1-C subfamily serine protease